MSASVLPPHEVVERALAAAASANPGGAAVAIAGATSSANLRWANNTLTTNGVMSGQSLTVVATDPRFDGVAAGVVSREVTDRAGVESLVADAVAASRTADVAEDARDLLPGSGSARLRRRARPHRHRRVRRCRAPRSAAGSARPPPATTRRSTD